MHPSHGCRKAQGAAVACHLRGYVYGYGVCFTALHSAVLTVYIVLHSAAGSYSQHTWATAGHIIRVSELADRRRSERRWRVPCGDERVAHLVVRRRPDLHGNAANADIQWLAGCKCGCTLVRQCAQLLRSGQCGFAACRWANGYSLEGTREYSGRLHHFTRFSPSARPSALNGNGTAALVR